LVGQHAYETVTSLYTVQRFRSTFQDAVRKVLMQAAA